MGVVKRWGLLELGSFSTSRMSSLVLRSKHWFFLTLRTSSPLPSTTDGTGLLQFPDAVHASPIWPLKPWLPALYPIHTFSVRGHLMPLKGSLEWEPLSKLLKSGSPSWNHVLAPLPLWRLFIPACSPSSYLSQQGSSNQLLSLDPPGMSCVPVTVSGDFNARDFSKWFLEVLLI